MRLLIPMFSPATGTWGGLTRVLAVADAAQHAGHVVAFCASGSLADALRSRGYTVYAAPLTTMLGLPASISRQLEQRSQRVTLPVRPGRSVGSIWLVFVVSGLARASYLRQLVDAELQAVRAFQADALFTDLDPGAFLLAAISELPLAATYAGIIGVGHGSLAWRLMRRAMHAVLHYYGKPTRAPDELCFGPHILKIIPSIPELDGTDPNRSDVCYVGHLLGDIELARSTNVQPGRRYVFVYAGTGSVSQDTLRRVLPQVFPDGREVVCLVGAQSVTRVERLGAVEFRPYVPAEAVLPYCDWTICHGGQNTIIQSLRHGVPLILFPGPIFERRFNAAQVQVAGAGLMGEIDQCTASWLQAALGRRPVYAPQAAVLAERISSYGGAPAAVAAMERVFAGRID